MGGHPPWSLSDHPTQPRRTSVFFLWRKFTKMQKKKRAACESNLLLFVESWRWHLSHHYEVGDIQQRCCHTHCLLCLFLPHSFIKSYLFLVGTWRFNMQTSKLFKVIDVLGGCSLSAQCCKLQHFRL